MSLNTYPGFIINSTTIAVDYWPKQKQPNLSHHFLTHCHTDHTKNLDSSWNGPSIYCSKISKKLLINLNQVKEEYIVELEIDKTHCITLDDDESFNVTLIDANHCPGAVMYLFEGYFGVILATGDFRYTPSMFTDTMLLNKKIDICYLDNTYFNPVFSNIPTRDEAFKQIITIIEEKRTNETLFQIHLRNLGKENILTDLAEYFHTPIVVSLKRYERLTDVLELNEKYFKTFFDSDSLIFVLDNGPSNSSLNQFLSSKKIIHIEPTALKISDKNQESEYNIKVPYTDHSSYEEIVKFVKKLKPKRLVPIVRKMLPNNIDTTDLKLLDKYLDKMPVKICTEKYQLLLQSSSFKRSSRLKMHSLGEEVKKISAVRNLTPINTRYVTRRKSIKNTKKRIEYDTPEKENPNDKEDSNKTPEKRVISIRKPLAKTHQFKNIIQTLTTIKEENRSDLSLSSISENELIANRRTPLKNSYTVEDITQSKANHSLEGFASNEFLFNDINENLINQENIKNSNWKRLNDQVEMLIKSPELTNTFTTGSLLTSTQIANYKSPEIIIGQNRSKISSRLNPVVVLKMLNEEEILSFQEKEKTNNLILNENENEENQSKESIVFEYTIKDQIESNNQCQQQQQQDLISSCENISSGQLIQDEEINNRNKQDSANNINNTINSINNNTNNFSAEFLKFMKTRLEKYDVLNNNEIKLNEMINNEILESFQF